MKRVWRYAKEHWQEEDSGQEGNIGPSIPGDCDYPPDWYGFLSEPKLSIICDADGKQLGYGSACDEVDRGSANGIVLRLDVDEEIPPYSWTIDGEGYHFGSIDGGTGWTTMTSGEIVEVYLEIGNGCVGRITVEDDCGNASIAFTRASDGFWSTYGYPEYPSFWDALTPYSPGTWSWCGYPGFNSFEIIEGKYKWEGNGPGTPLLCYSGSPSPSTWYNPDNPSMEIPYLPESTSITPFGLGESQITGSCPGGCKPLYRSIRLYYWSCY